MTDVQASIAAVWLNELYTRLRRAEARAADSGLSPPERSAAAATAGQLARQIEAYETWILRGRVVLAA